MTQNKCERLQGGFTLVELMVAMLISLLLMGGVIQVFSSSSKSYRNHEGLSRIQENGRFAMEFLSRDIRMADFWGCANNVSKVTNNLDPLNGGTNWQYNFGSGGVGGTDGGGNAPDSLIMRGAVGTGLGVQPPYGPQASSNLKVLPNNGLAQGDIIIVSDCQAADIVQLTNANPDGSGTLVHNTGSSQTPGNFNSSNPGCPGANAHCLSKVYGDDAQIFSSRSVTYTIATNATTGQPGLYRDPGIGPQELVDGVTNLQILYGEDTDADGTANYYVPATSVADMEMVVSLKISLLVQSYEDNLADTPMTYTYNGATTTAGDNRLYQVFNSTVTVRNRVQ
jgi:type IV pilus assembly protein PilW